MPFIQKDMGVAHEFMANSTNGTNGTNRHAEPFDVVIIGAGFSGIYLLHQLRKRNFKAKIVEAGSSLGGVWHWNRYPGARVDSPYPIYQLSLPEVYEDWTWSSHYPDHNELRDYFDHADKKLEISKDTIYNTKVTAAEWDDKTSGWTIHCNTGATLNASFFLACTGFAAKRHFPDWKGMDLFKGQIFHSSFWPEEGVDVTGKRCAVVGSGATGIQIVQEWAKDVGPNGNLIMFQRTPSLACPMNQVWLTKEEQDLVKKTLQQDVFDQRLNNASGFLYQYRPIKTLDHSPEEREALYQELWKIVGLL